MLEYTRLVDLKLQGIAELPQITGSSQYHHIDRHLKLLNWLCSRKGSARALMVACFDRTATLKVLIVDLCALFINDNNFNL